MLMTRLVSFIKNKVGGIHIAIPAEKRLIITVSIIPLIKSQGTKFILNVPIPLNKYVEKTFE